jgi:hypothetical protein
MARKILATVGGDGELVFTTSGRSPVSGWSKIKMRLDGAMEIPPWRLHDLRRTAATGMAEIGIAPHIVEAALNHVSGARAGVAGTYNRAAYAPEKRAALERWVAHIEGLVAGKPANVVTLPAGAQQMSYGPVTLGLPDDEHGYCAHVEGYYAHIDAIAVDHVLAHLAATARPTDKREAAYRVSVERLTNAWKEENQEFGNILHMAIVWGLMRPLKDHLASASPSHRASNISRSRSDSPVSTVAMALRRISSSSRSIILSS